MMRTRRSAGGLLAAVIAVALAAGASPAVAAPGDGLWYYDLFNLKTAHDAGFTGEGVTIAVLDSQLNPDIADLSDADITVMPSECLDESGDRISATSTGTEASHGTAVVSLLVGKSGGVAPDAKIVFFDIFAPPNAAGDLECLDADGEDSLVSDAAAVLAAVDAHVDIISVSAGLNGTVELANALAIAESEGIVVIAGVPNDQEFHGVLEGTFPYSANGIVGVQSIDVNGQIAGASDIAAGDDNHNLNTDVVAPGVGILTQGVEEAGTMDWGRSDLADGTSFATPITAGMLALVKQKYPEATGNQLIQTLIRNTSGEDHELSYDGSYLYGYGVVSASHMLEKDPTQYDDVNPLLTDDPGAKPTMDQVLNPQSLDDWVASMYGGSKPGSAASESPSDVDPTGVPIWLLAVIVGIGALVIVGVVVVIIVIASRKSRNPAQNQGARS